MSTSDYVFDGAARNFDRKEHTMRTTTWRVTEVNATEGLTLAHLSRVEWMKRNPAFDTHIDEGYEGDPPDEWIDAEPGEHGADFITESHESLTLDITDGLDVRPGDNVILTVAVVEHVPV